MIIILWKTILLKNEVTISYCAANDIHFKIMFWITYLMLLSMSMFLNDFRKIHGPHSVIFLYHFYGYFWQLATYEYRFDIAAGFCLSFNHRHQTTRWYILSSWWRHPMETFSALLALCAGNSPVPVNSPHKGQWRVALMFSLICVCINGWVNNLESGDLRRYRGHYDVIVMIIKNIVNQNLQIILWWTDFEIAIHCHSVFDQRMNNSLIPFPTSSRHYTGLILGLHSLFHVPNGSLIRSVGGLSKSM